MNPKTQDKINELVDLFASSLKVECERLYRSGAIDVDSYNHADHYFLPKILVTAAILRRKDDFTPLHKQQIETVKNLTRI